jgi:hypothetical protein
MLSSLLNLIEIFAKSVRFHLVALRVVVVGQAYACRGSAGNLSDRSNRRNPGLLAGLLN